jgi:hypothetical protein
MKYVFINHSSVLYNSFWWISGYLIHMMYEIVSLNWYSALYIRIQMSTDARLRIHNIISKAEPRYGSELRALNIKEHKQLETT